MFSSHSRAEVCYAYLEDVTVPNPSDENSIEAIGDSRWFKRGWTLQELVAPRHVEFYSRDCSALSDRRSWSNLLSQITGIDERILSFGWEPTYNLSIAKRMSWAANRETTRPEDIAYCLLGIFDVNMPLLYGERDESILSSSATDYGKFY